MVRKIRDAKLETRAARTKIKGATPCYKAVGPDIALGYRNGKRGGSWLARIYNGDRSYRVEVIGRADDHVEPDGTNVLDFWQAVALAQKLRTQPADVPAGPYRVRDAIGDYLAFLKANRKTGSDVSYRAHAHILPALGDKRVDRLTAADITRWHHDLAKQLPRLRTKPGAIQRTKPDLGDDEEARRKRRLSANRCLSPLKAALNMAWRDGKVASDEAWRRVRPYHGVDVARVRYLSVAEAQRLINACEPDFRSLVQAAVLTGARYGELCRLVVADINIDVGTLAIRTSKTGKPRHIVLTEEGGKFFAGICAGRDGAELMFRRDGTAWLKSQQIRRMREACQRAKINPPIGFHQLRHTWASLSVMAGVPLMIVGKNLGHADTRMVERHYGHLAQSYIVDAIRAGAPRFGIEPTNVSSMRGKRQ